MRLLLALSLLVLSALPGHARKIEYRDCSSSSRARIEAGVNWLLSRLPELDSHLGQHGLAAWSGKSHERFSKRLRSNKLRFSCHKECPPSRFTYQSIGTWRLPVGHGSRIPICTSELAGVAEMAAVIAHGMGHLVWINAHRRTCHDRCTKPRIATSLLHAVFHVATATRFDQGICLAACGPVPPTDPTSTPPPVVPPPPEKEPPEGE